MTKTTKRRTRTWLGCYACEKEATDSFLSTGPFWNRTWSVGFIFVELLYLFVSDDVGGVS